MGILTLLISIYQVVLLIRFVMQWIDKDGTNQLNSALKPLTEPVMAPLRSRVTVNGIDFSALVVSFLLQIFIVLFG